MQPTGQRMEGFGEQLRQERVRRGVELEAVSAETRVQTRHLEALEASRYGDLPGGVFRRGILRAYLHFLDLEETAWMARFEQSYTRYAQQHGLEADGGSHWQEFAENVKRNRSAAASSNGLRWLMLAVLLVVVLVAAAATWKFLLHGQFAP